MPNRVDPPALSSFLYRYRNPVERFFNRLKHYRAIAARYDKHAGNYLATVKLASIRIWLRHYESVSWKIDIVGQITRAYGRCRRRRWLLTKSYADAHLEMEIRLMPRCFHENH